MKPLDVRSTTFPGPVIKPGEFAEQTTGGHFELVSEFEVPPRGRVNPHHHPTYEFYLVASGRGLMIIGDAEREVGPGDFIVIPSEALHSLVTLGDTAIRCFAFAVAVNGASPVDYGTDSGVVSPDEPESAEVYDALVVRRVADIEPSLVHRGSVAVWWIVPPRAMRAATLGGRLNSVSRLALNGVASPVKADLNLHVYAVLDGLGSVIVLDREVTVSRSDVVLTGAGRDHVFTGDLSLLEIQYAVLS